MKAGFRIIAAGIFLLVSAMVHGQDYYSGKTSISGDNNDYEIITGSSFVCLTNKANKFKLFGSGAYYTDTRERLIYMPHLDCDEKVLERILSKVFTREEIASYNSTRNYIDIVLTVNPRTGEVIEVMRIDLVNSEDDDKVLLSIPITKLERLEELLIKRVVYDVPPKYNTANYVTDHFLLFFEGKYIFQYK